MLNFPPSPSQTIATHVKSYSSTTQPINSNNSTFSNSTAIKGHNFLPSVAQQQILLADAGGNDVDSYGKEDTSGEAGALAGLACSLSLMDANPITTAFLCAAVGYGTGESGVQLPESDFDPHGQPWDDTDYGTEND